MSAQFNIKNVRLPFQAIQLFVAKSIQFEYKISDAKARQCIFWKSQPSSIKCVQLLNLFAVGKAISRCEFGDINNLALKEYDDESLSERCSCVSDWNQWTLTVSLKWRAWKRQLQLGVVE